MNNKIERVLTWEKFRELLTKLCPNEVYYAQGKAPLARPPIELRLTFTSEGTQYIFVDTADKGVMRRTKIPVKTDKYGNFSLQENDIKIFIFTELERDDIEVRSFELIGGY